MRRALMLPIAIATLAGLAVADEKGPELRVLFPEDGATILAGESDLICILADGRKPPRLKVNGKRVRWEPYALPVLAAKLDLAPGEHGIAIGKTKLTVRADAVGDGGFRSHADEQLGWKECAACHEVEERNGREVVGDPDQPDACMKCHSAEDFELAHFHPLDPIAACNGCHAVHGHEAEALLKEPVKELCAACHE